MNSRTSLKSMYTDANRTYATLSSFFSRCMIISPISVVVSSRSVASCTTPSISSTIASSFGVATGRFSQAFNNPCKIFCRSNRSRRPSFLITMYGISSIRSYVVKRREHFRHSRRRRMVSPVRPSRESITLSSRCAQKGHFNWGCLRGAFLFRERTTKTRATQEGGASPPLQILCGGLACQFGFDLLTFAFAHAFQFAQRPAFAEKQRNAGKRAGRERNQPQNHGGGHCRLSFYSIELSESND